MYYKINIFIILIKLFYVNIKLRCRVSNIFVRFYSYDVYPIRSLNIWENVYKVK